MGMMDKFKNFIGIPEDEYYDDEVDSSPMTAARRKPRKK